MCESASSLISNMSALRVLHFSGACICMYVCVAPLIVGVWSMAVLLWQLFEYYTWTGNSSVYPAYLAFWQPLWIGSGLRIPCFAHLTYTTACKFPFMHSHLYSIILFQTHQTCLTPSLGEVYTALQKTYQDLFWFLDHRKRNSSKTLCFFCVNCTRYTYAYWEPQNVNLT